MPVPNGRAREADAARARAAGKGLPAGGKDLPDGGEWASDMLESAARLIDPVSLLIVIGGTFAVAAIRSTREDIGRALRALGPFLCARPARDAQGARRALLKIESVAELKGVICADHVATPVAFLRAAARRLSDDAGHVAAFRRWAEEALAARDERHKAAIAVWRSAADVAPAIGMIGTVIGLVGMFAHMADPAAMGPAMALAMLTTLYGLILGAGLCGPVAARLERLSEAELAWQEAALDRLAWLAEEEAREGELRRMAAPPRRLRA